MVLNVLLKRLSDDCYKTGEKVIGRGKEDLNVFAPKQGPLSATECKSSVLIHNAGVDERSTEVSAYSRGEPEWMVFEW